MNQNTQHRKECCYEMPLRAVHIATEGSWSRVPSSTWSVHLQPLRVEHRATILCERWINTFSRLVGHSHPMIWNCLAALQKYKVISRRKGYSKQRRRVWWQAISMTSRQSGRQPYSFSSICRIVLIIYGLKKSWQRGLFQLNCYVRTFAPYRLSWIGVLNLRLRIARRPNALEAGHGLFAQDARAQHDLWLWNKAEFSNCCAKTFFWSTSNGFGKSTSTMLLILHERFARSAFHTC